MSAVLAADVVGTAAGLCSMASFTPQICKIVCERDASAVSLRMYLITVTGFVLWTIYGLLLGSWPVWASNSINLILAGTILMLKWRLDAGASAAPGVDSAAADRKTP